MIPGGFIPISATYDKENKSLAKELDMVVVAVE